MQHHPPPRAITRRTFLHGVTVVALALTGACSGSDDTRQPAKLPSLGFIGVGPNPRSWAEFREGMRQLGWTENQNFTAEEAFSADRADMPTLAAGLVQRRVELLVAFGTAGAQAAQQATSTIPIVMFGIASDPVELGLVSSLSRPGGNVTSVLLISPQLSGKRLELLAAVVPGCSRVGALVTPGNPSRPFLVKETQGAAEAMGLQLRIFDVDSPEEIVAASEAARSWPVDGLLVLPDARLQTMLPTVVESTMRNHQPLMLQNSSGAREQGALMSYGPLQSDHNRRAAYFVDKILHGTRPADLPLEYPNSFEFVVNVTAARALAISFPPPIAAQVTEWVE